MQGLSTDYTDAVPNGIGMQTGITIRMVLPPGVAAPDVDKMGGESLCGLLGALVYTLYPLVAQDVQIDVDVERLPLPVVDSAIWADVAMSVRF